MLTYRYRPNRFSEIVGQDLNSEILKALVKDPQEAPRCLLFHGSYGTGKTVSARVFARSLNCENLSPESEPCLSCPSCKDDLQGSPLFQEIDCSEVNAERMREMKDDLFSPSPLCRYRVIVFDEFQLSSPTAQSALLKVLEEMPENLFVIFITTDLLRVVAPVRSRSVEFKFDRVSEVSIISRLKAIAKAEQMEVSEETFAQIVAASRGHVRNAVMSLNLYKVFGNTEKFAEVVKTCELELLAALKLARVGDKEKFQQVLGGICGCPLESIKFDLYNVSYRLIRKYVDENVSVLYDHAYRDVVSVLGKDVFRLFSYIMEPWAGESFKEDVTFQALMWSMYHLFAGAKNPQNNMAGERMRRR